VPIATLGALRNPREFLLNPYCAQILFELRVHLSSPYRPEILNTLACFCIVAIDGLEAIKLKHFEIYGAAFPPANGNSGRGATGRRVALRLVKQNPSRRIKLLQEIKICAIPGQHCASMFSGGCE